MPAYDGDSFDPPAPTARVSLRNPQNGEIVSDIGMLLDSGADVTLIPAAAAHQLALTVEPDMVVEVMGFEGTVTIASVVQLEMSFSGKTFRGRFLLTDQAWGVIGRDVLNLVTLLLDGPGLTWLEHRRSP